MNIFSDDGGEMRMEEKGNEDQWGRSEMGLSREKEDWERLDEMDNRGNRNEMMNRGNRNEMMNRNEMDNRNQSKWGDGRNQSNEGWGTVTRNRNISNTLR